MRRLDRNRFEEWKVCLDKCQGAAKKGVEGIYTEHFARVTTQALAHSFGGYR